MRYSKILHVLMTDIGEIMYQSDHRLIQLQQWVMGALPTSELLPLSDGVPPSWEAVSGDASFRRYFRVIFNGDSYIVMDAPPTKEPISPFVDIAGRLRQAGIRAPIIFAQQLEDGFLLLEDLGDDMLQSLLAEDSGQLLFDYVLPVMVAMASDCNAESLPSYSAVKLYEELNLFSDWYLQHHLAVGMSEGQLKQWQHLCQILVDNALAQPQVFVHRDFHSCNLHRLANNEIGVIDFQDAVCGPLTYDLVSWLWDRYITWTRPELELWMQQARAQLAPEVDEEDWIRWCDLMGLQRNLKIIGIFSRLHYRDNKLGYLAMIPRFTDYVSALLPRYPELQPSYTLLTPWIASQ